MIKFIVESIKSLGSSTKDTFKVIGSTIPLITQSDNIIRNLNINLKSTSFQPSY